MARVRERGCATWQGWGIFLWMLSALAAVLAYLLGRAHGEA